MKCVIVRASSSKASTKNSKTFETFITQNNTAVLSVCWYHNRCSTFQQRDNVQLPVLSHIGYSECPPLAFMRAHNRLVKLRMDLSVWSCVKSLHLTH